VRRTFQASTLARACLAAVCRLVQGASAQQMPADVSAADASSSVETCKAMFGHGSRLDAAVNDPRARKPGDEALTCAQLFAELRKLADVSLSESAGAQLSGVESDGQAASVRGSAELTGFMFETAADEEGMRAAAGGRAMRETKRYSA
jgi:hypothetical protein